MVVLAFILNRSHSVYADVFGIQSSEHLWQQVNIAGDTIPMEKRHVSLTIASVGLKTAEQVL